MAVVTYVVATIAVGVIIIRKYREWAWGQCTDVFSLKGKVYLITGANCGIGFETAKQLLHRHATVIMANRDEKKTETAVKEIRKFTNNGEIISHSLDLSSFKSVRQFCQIVNEKHSKIDVLINNAGLSVPLQNNTRTEEGFEMNIGVNHLGHFLLTNLLVQKLRDSAPSRIVIVASTLHEKGRVNEEYLNDINLDKLRATGARPTLSPGYCASKLANVYHGRELAKRLEKDKVDVRMVCPGLTYTGLFRYSSIRWFHYILFAPVALYFLRSAWKGSQTVMYCATRPELPGKSGDFYRDCGLYQSKAKFNDSIQGSLWALSEKLTSSRFP